MNQSLLKHYEFVLFAICEFYYIHNLAPFDSTSIYEANINSGLTKRKIKRIINTKRQLVVEGRFSSRF